MAMRGNPPALTGMSHTKCTNVKFTNALLYERNLSSGIHLDAMKSNTCAAFADTEELQDVHIILLPILTRLCVERAIAASRSCDIETGLCLIIFMLWGCICVTHY